MSKSKSPLTPIIDAIATRLLADPEIRERSGEGAMREVFSKDFRSALHEAFNPESLPWIDRITGKKEAMTDLIMDMRDAEKNHGLIEAITDSFKLAKTPAKATVKAVVKEAAQVYAFCEMQRAEKSGSEKSPAYGHLV